MNLTNTTPEKIDSMYSLLVIILIVLTVQCVFSFYHVFLLVALNKGKTYIPIITGRHATLRDEVILLQDDIALYRITRLSGRHTYVFEIHENARQVRQRRRRTVERVEMPEMRTISDQVHHRSARNPRLQQLQPPATIQED